jgi:putative ABC transport system permease protein
MDARDRLPHRLFRFASRLLPFDFRREYEREMELAFASDLDEARQTSGGVWSVIGRALAGLGPVALREHFLSLAQDVRYSLRSFAKAPAFTATAVLSLGLGLGATTAVFSFVDATFFHALPVAHEEQLVALHTIDSRNPGFNPTSFPNYRDYRDHVKGLSGLAAYTLSPVNLAASGEPVLGMASVVTGNYFGVLGVRPALGRLIAPGDDRVDGQTPAAVMSNGLWVRQFASDPGVVGRTVKINGLPCDIVGVLPREFTGTDAGLRVDLWLPMSGYQRFIPGITNAKTERRLLQFNMIGRLVDGAAPAAVQGELDALSSQLQHDFPEANRGRSVNLMPLRDALVDPNIRPTLLLASKAIGLVVVVVLLIACMNVANLLVGRAASRRTEIAVRVALGAGRARIARQLVTEQVLIGLAGAVVGVVLGAAAWRTLWAVRPTNAFPVVELPTEVNGRLLIFSVVVAIGTSLVFGLAPMLQVFGRAPIQDLRERGAGHTVRRWGLRNLLLVCEVALAIVALVSAGLFFHSFQNARQIPTGFATERLLTGYIDLGAQGYTESQSQTFSQTLITRLRGLPGVRGASLSTVMPFVNGGFSRTVFLEGDAPPPGGNGQFVTANAVDETYFDTMGLRLASGRRLAEYDTAAAPAVAVVNQTMARRFWPSGDPIGHRFHFFGERSVQIVGVVSDSKVASVGEEPSPIAYVALRQWPDRGLTINVRTERDPAGLAGPIRAEVRALDPELPILALDTMSDHLSTALWNARMGAFVVGTFAAISLLLALVGLYGVLTYAITVRRRELAVRIALGAGRGQILSMLAWETLRVMAPALLVGLVAAAMVGRLTAGLLYEVPGIDVPTFAAVPALFLIAAILAVLRPARQATRTDPTLVLRGN